eukprot:TRINITY_DN16210_c0_g1_i1.p1 TRINITY_DN16210_c0_g1~~TRINITY_DN16210_c0_g1_i1.p1  ORF type:complete len:129 (+),score=23.46 TRINITY_DN16210_c0_g1_i1:50-388(+)
MSEPEPSTEWTRDNEHRLNELQRRKDSGEELALEEEDEFDRLVAKQNAFLEQGMRALSQSLPTRKRLTVAEKRARTRARILSAMAILSILIFASSGAYLYFPQNGTNTISIN